MDERFERQTHEVEDRHWWYRGRRAVLAQALDALELPGEPGQRRILDAGCGSGRNMVELQRWGQVTGLEVAQASVAMARSRQVGDVVAGTLETLPFPDDNFHLAVSLDVVEHLDDDRRALRELRRVVMPGGSLLLTVPAYPWLWSSHDEINHHRRRYTRTTLLAAAQDAGWIARRWTYFNALLLPAAAGHRLLRRVRPAPQAPVSDLERTPQWLNRILEQPMRLESRAVGAGRRIPAGLSLLAVLE